jgi:EAL domain-containing protein (putative c-di-GMP-specific phosphodiesterase class I)
VYKQQGAWVKSSAFEMALQPIVDLMSGRVVGVESLARFDDRRPPDAHFAEAETGGRRLALELRAVRAGLARIGELPRDAYLTINVSPETATSGGLAEVLAAAPTDRVVLELTEHAPVGDYDRLTTALDGLRSRGVRIAVDDAGAGFASMRHVLALHPDVIKLDVSIIRGINVDPGRREFVRALVQFSRATGCTLIAEGIETSEELAQVRRLGVSCGQGFWLGRPERASAGPWQLALPKMHRWHRNVASSTGRHGRVGRPASVLLAAAIAWPGIVAAVGLKAPSAGGQRQSSSAADTRRVDGGSSQLRAQVPGPTAVLRRVKKNAVVRVAQVRAKPSADPSPTPAPKDANVVGETVQGLGQVVDGVLETTTQTVRGFGRTVGSLLGGGER